MSGYRSCRDCSFFVLRFGFVLLVAMLAFDASVADGQDPQDVSRLAHPEVAQRLDLDDQQRAAIQELIQQRTEAGALDDAEERQQKLEELDEQIREVLSEEQWERWQDDAPEGYLEFQFREQPWTDVLQWFAKQEGLTLVMDRDPPGTFTYSDTRRYTATEAIDLLNSVLLTRGYTLVRREKMLTVLELSDSIPIELIPEVELEELPSRGRFELVRVKFALGRRPVDQVVKEVTPYLGRYGRALPLAQSRQLVVIETAGKMETINVLVNSVPEPKKSAPPEPKEKPPEPVFAAYPLGQLDPAATLEAMQKLVASEQITVDESTSLLTAFLIPNEQVALQKAIEQMRESLEESPGETSVAYRMGEADAEVVREQVTAVAPRAVVSADADGRRLMVTAAPSDQEKVEAVLEALGVTRSGADHETRAFQVEVGQAETLATSLQSMLSDSRAVGNDSLGTLVVRGPAEELELADEVIRRWRGDDGIAEKVLHAFSLPRPASSDWLETVARVAPMAELWLGPGDDQLVMLGSSAERERIEGALPQLTTAIPEAPSRELRIHALKPAELERWEQLESGLGSQLDEVRVVVESDADRRLAQLLVWATAKDHDWIEGVLEQIQEATPDAELLWPRRYPFDDRDADLVGELIETRFPGVRFSVEPAAEEVTIWAAREEHEEIGELLAAVQEELPSRPAMTIRGYSVPGMSLDELESLVEPIVDQDGEITVTADPSRQRLLIRADEETHRRLEELNETLQTPPPSDQEKILMAYTLEHADADDLKSLLENVIRGVNVIADSQRGRLVATATLQQHGRIKTVVAEVDQAGDAGTEKQVRTYPLDELQATALLPTLESMWPKMELSVDEDSNQVIASGTATDHEALRTALDQIGGAEQGELRVETYAMPVGDLRTLPSVLSQIAPEAVISTDRANDAVVVWASDAEHERIEKAIEQLSETAAPSEELLLFRVPPEEASNYRSLLSSLYPAAKVSSDSGSGRLTILTPAPLQQGITELIEERLQAGELEDEPEPQSYRVDRSIRDAFLTLLDTTAPSARQVDNGAARGDAVMVVALPQDHEKIAQMLERLETQMEKPEETEVRVYELSRTEPAAFSGLLQDRRPEARVVGGEGTKRFVIADTAAGHQAVDELLQELEGAFGDADERRLRVHPVRGDLAPQAAQGVATVVPEATLLSGGSQDRLAVIATESEHERLAEWLEELRESVPEPSAKRSRVFQLRSGDAAALAEAAAQLAPDASVSAEESSNTLVVTAGADAIAEIEQLVRDVEEGETGPLVSKTYVLEQGSPTTFENALSEIYPGAKVAADRSSGGLLVSATAEQHVQIEALVEDLNSAPGRAEGLTSYQLNHADAGEVASALEQAFGRRSTAGVSADVEAGFVFVVGRPEHQQIASELIEQMDRADAERVPRRLKIFSAAGVSGSDVAASIERLFETARPPVDVEYDMFNEQLVVIGSEEQLQRVEDTLKQFEPAERQVEIYPLMANDPEPVREAIDSLFSELPYNAAPTVLVDDNRQQLMVRATTEQLEQIETLLGRLGESVERSDAPAAPGRAAGGPGERVRTVPVGEDAEAVLRRLEELWPSVRDNPLRVIRPRVSGPAAAGATDEEDPSTGREAAEEDEVEDDPAPVPEAELGDQRRFDSSTHTFTLAPAQTGETGEEESQAAPAIPAEPDKLQPPLVPPEPDDAAPPKTPEAAETPPVLIIPGSESWTIASEDPLALEALTELIEQAFPRSATAIPAGTNHAVYVLRYADASELESVLTNLFRSGGRRRSQDRSDETRVVADPRINALIVRGSRSDRSTVEELLAVLDSPEYVGAFQPSPPQYVPVHNADVERVAQVLETVYQNELASGGGRPPITIPAGISEDLATMLRQINAAASGPLLTISVDRLTNAIVMRAPPELAKEIQAFIKQVDQETDERRSQGLRIVPLTESNAGQMEEAIRALRAVGRR